MTIGLAVIGAGRWGPNYVRIFRGMAETSVVAAVDPSAEARKKLQAAFPGLECTADLDAVLKRQDVQAVVVATPTSTHSAVVTAALQAGKHVLCEKPLAASSREAWELVGMTGEIGVGVSADTPTLRHSDTPILHSSPVLMTGHVFLFNPGIEYLKQVAGGAEIGKPFYISAVRTNLGPFRKDVNAAWDLASHDIYVFNWLLGMRPEAVSAAGGTYLQKGVEDIVFLTLRYPSGVMGHIHISWLDPKKVRQLTLVTEKKMVTWDEFGSPGPVMIYDRAVTKEPSYSTFGEFQLLTREGDVAVPRVKTAEPLSAQAREFVQRCLGKSADKRGSAEQGAEVVDILEASSRSLAEESRFVDVAYGDSPI